MICIGIDPGLSGALAILDGESATVTLWGPEAYAKALRYATEKGPCVACLEHVGARPGQGVTSTFRFGENFGFCQGMLTAYGIRYELVRPQKWKKEFSVSGKNASIAVCKRLFPGVDLRRTEKCRIDHDGKAEALLMAEYARRRLA